MWKNFWDHIPLTSGHLTPQTAIPLIIMCGMQSSKRPKKPQKISEQHQIWTEGKVKGSIYQCKLGLVSPKATSIGNRQKGLQEILKWSGPWLKPMTISLKNFNLLYFKIFSCNFGWYISTKITWKYFHNDKVVNAHKTEYMCFNQTGDISTLNGSTLKLVDKFIYLGSSVSSTETDIDTRLAKAWTAIDGLSVIWKSDLTDKMKRSFFQAAVVSILLYECTTWTLTKCKEKTLDSNHTRMQYWNSPRDSTRQSSSCVATYYPSRKLSKLDEPDMQDTAGEVGTNS